MTKQAARGWSVFVLAIILAAQPMSAQKQPRGWPDSGGHAAKSTKAVPAAKAARPAAKAVSVKPVKARARVTVAEPRPAAVNALAAEVLSVLHQQTELLKRLSFEIEAQRSLMLAQQDKIHALELRAAMAASAPAAVETEGTRLNGRGFVHDGDRAATFATGRFEYAPGLFTGPGEGFGDAGKNERRMWVSRNADRPSFIKGLQMNYLRKTFAGAGVPRDWFVTNLHKTW